MTAGEKGTGTPGGDARDRRIHRSVEVIERSIRRWSDYAADTTRRCVQGNLAPGDWVRGWADLWSGVAHDVEDLVKVCLDRPADEPPKAAG